MVQTAATSDTNYPFTQQLNITFSPYEDRLVVKAGRAVGDGTICMLLTRRMVMIVLQQLLGKLPKLTGLDKTPAQYWQEVLQMAHQQAMQAKQAADESTAQAEAAKEHEAPTDESQPAEPPTIYLATELTVKLEEKQLIIAFRGLPMPRAMVTASTHEPVFAMPLQADHVHQMIQLLITKSQEAQWHLPLDLPWLENPKAQPTSLGSSASH